MTALLNMPMPIDEAGEVVSPVLEPALEAQLAWTTFHNAVENELRERVV